jgi:hypothetical protein
MRRRPLAAEADVARRWMRWSWNAPLTPRLTSLRTAVARHAAGPTQSGFTSCCEPQPTESTAGVCAGWNVALREADQVYVITYWQRSEFVAKLRYFRSL